MNKHVKLAFIIAPLLIVGGFVAAEYYSKYQFAKKRYHQLSVTGPCEIFQDKCTLKGAGLTLDISSDNGTTFIKSDHPLSTAAIALVDDNQEKPKNLEPDSERQSWTINTMDFAGSRDAVKNQVRLVVSVKDQFFFSEFSSGTSH